MNFKNILIIGGGGYIGSRLAQEISNNNNVVCLDNFIHTTKKIDNINYIKQDYGNVTKDYLSNFDIIILLAGHSSVRMCDLYPTSVLENNVINFTSLVEKLNEKHTLIYASSGSVYGDCQTDPVAEDYVLNKPHNMYDLSKQLIDTYTLMGNHKCSIIGLRFGTVNGSSPVFRDDVMLNAMTSTALKTNEILLFNPNTKRSILGINDLCRAIVSIINNDKKLCDVYNLCSFTKTSKEMALIVSDIVQCPVKEIDASSFNTATTKLNEKLVSSKYNFALSCDKFISNFNFVFNETPDMIVENILKNKNNMIYTNRNTPFLYKREC